MTAHTTAGYLLMIRGGSEGGELSIGVAAKQVMFHRA